MSFGRFRRAARAPEHAPPDGGSPGPPSRRRSVEAAPYGRAYDVRIEIMYVGGTLPDGERTALRAALRTIAPRATLSVRPGPHDVVVVTATRQAGTPLRAIADLDQHLDRALLDTGLFEVFDSTGRTLHVAPAERDTAPGDPTSGRDPTSD